MSIKIVSTDLPKSPAKASRAKPSDTVNGTPDGLVSRRAPRKGARGTEQDANPIVGEGVDANPGNQPSVPSPGVPLSDKTLSEAQVANLIAGHVKGLGGTVAAGVKWGVSDQMVRMVMGAHRRPSESMLADLGLEEIPAVRRYRKVRRTK